MHRKSERNAISKRKFIFKHYKTLKSLNKMIKVGVNGFGRIGFVYLICKSVAFLRIHRLIKKRLYL